jgi:hypothetical protein
MVTVEYEQPTKDNFTSGPKCMNNFTVLYSLHQIRLFPFKQVRLIAFFYFFFFAQLGYLWDSTTSIILWLLCNKTTKYLKTIASPHTPPLFFFLFIPHPGSPPSGFGWFLMPLGVQSSPQLPTCLSSHHPLHSTLTAKMLQAESTFWMWSLILSSFLFFLNKCWN